MKLTVEVKEETKENTKDNIRCKNRVFYYPINDKINLFNNYTSKSDKYVDFKINRKENDFNKLK